MDAERFDSLVRRLTRPRSRRTFVPAVVAAWAGLFGAIGKQEQAAAQQASVPLGGACYDHFQCYNDVDTTTRPDLNYQNQLVWCMDNGIWQDGERNCCRYEGGLCWLNAHCCQDLTCIEGHCGGYFFN